MARYLAAASSQYLYTTTGCPISGEPFTMACWFNDNDVATARTLISVADKDSADGYHSLMASGNIGGDPVTALSTSAGATGASSTSGFTASTWYHACGIWYAANSRAAFINGGSKGTDATNKVVANLDRAGVGANLDASPSAYFDGSIAEAAIWDDDLSDAEVAVLATGISPLLVHPQSLVAYWRLINEDDDDCIGNFDLTTSGSPTWSVHPRVRYGVSPIMLPFSGVCVTTITLTVTVTITVMG